MSEGVPSVHANDVLIVYRSDTTHHVFFGCTRCGRRWKASKVPVESKAQIGEFPPDAFKCWECDVPHPSVMPEAG